MSRFALLVCLGAVVPLLAADSELDKTLKGVEARYNHAQTLQVSFNQTYGVPGGVKRSESGELYLLKPGRMLWEYSSPKGKFFLSDGKYLYLYNPSANRVERTKAKESEDMRAPLAFLLGKLNFRKDFKDFQTTAEGGNTWISCAPKTADLPYTKVEFLITPAYQILGVRVTGQDLSQMNFLFNQEKLNPPLNSKLFQFKKPAGAEVVEGAEQGQTG